MTIENPSGFSRHVDRSILQNSLGWLLVEGIFTSPAAVGGILV